jgi:hypothetical protein
MPFMKKPTRTHIAAGGTLAGLGVLAAVAIGAGAGEPVTTAAVPKTQPVEVRTVVVHRTIRVVRHQKPKKPKAAAAPPAPVVSSHPVQIAQVPAAQPTVQPVSTRPVPASTKPLKTASSGGGEGEEHEDNDREDNEHEGGDDD